MPLLSGSRWPLLVVPFGILYISQLELFNNLLRITIIIIIIIIIRNYAAVWKLSNKVKLAIFVEGDPRVYFSIAITLICREGTNSFHGLLHFTLDPYLIMPSVKQGSIKYHFLSLRYDSTWDWTPVSRTIGEQSTH